MDGGVRHGTDILKALAMGARAVFIGRPILWGLTYNGQEGVETVLKMLRDEFRVAMMLSGIQLIISHIYVLNHSFAAGCKSVADIQPCLVVSG